MTHTVRNPADHDLWCDPLQRSLAAKEVVEIGDDEAALLKDSPIFEVDGQIQAAIDKANKPDETTANETATAQRTDSKRGSVVAEQSAAPETEKRA